jgi:hypothetical protein
MNPDSDPSIFITDLQDANKKQIKKKFFCIILYEGTFPSFSKVESKKQKKRCHKMLDVRRIQIRIRIHISD